MQARLRTMPARLSKTMETPTGHQTLLVLDLPARKATTRRTTPGGGVNLVFAAASRSVKRFD